MAIHASALKRARQSEKRRLHNASIKTLLKKYSKKVIQAIDSKNPGEAQKALKSAIPALQRASSKRKIHKKTAARKISRLTRKVNAIPSPG